MVWTKINNVPRLFDVTMSAYDGADVCEFAGILFQFSTKYNQNNDKDDNDDNKNNDNNKQDFSNDNSNDNKENNRNNFFKHFSFIKLKVYYNKTLCLSLSTNTEADHK